MNTRIYLLFLLLFCSSFTFAKNDPEHRPGQLIVQLKKGGNVESFIAQLNRSSEGKANIYLKRAIIPDWDIYLIGFEESFLDEELLLEQALQMPDIQFAQWNHLVEDRILTPNDDNWFLQSDMTLIKAPEAWSTSVGGLTPNGDTIVVAVLEKGALLTHPDLAPNRWYNWADKPGNGADEDGNGYTDDFGGWNVDTHQDDLGNEGWHGTGVFGIIGAAGNNGIGVAGVNWNVKMMNVTGVNDDVNILDAYYYVYKMRKMYNESNGEKGAFIVATNASFGYNKQFPSSSLNFTTWCALYDSLGKIGVLNVGATTNEETNVDVDGDMPTSCGSPFLISVTEITTLGARTVSGYGKVSIDLGAPGQGTYTTTTVNGTPSYSSSLGGTSAAAPHVTGAVALLYSLGCEGFTSDAISDPEACAARVRDVILDNTEPNDDLLGRTVTGGHLDLERAVTGVTELCAGKVGPLDILQVNTFRTGNRLRVYYQTPIFVPYRFRVFNSIGQMMYDEELNPKQFSENYVDYDFSNLPNGVYMVSISRGNAIATVKFPKS